MGVIMADEGDKEAQRLLRAMSGKAKRSTEPAKGTPEWKRRQRRIEEEREEKEAADLAQMDAEKRAQKEREIARMNEIRNAAATGEAKSTLSVSGSGVDTG